MEARISFGIVASLGIALFATGCAGVNEGPNAAEAAFDPQTCAEEAMRHGADPAVAADAPAYFKEACATRDFGACSLLGLVNELGFGVPKNLTRARGLYTYACDSGNKRACGNLGELVIGEAKDAQATKDGIALLDRACSGGSARHCGVLGWTYATGPEATRSPALGAKLLERSCIGGNATGCLALAGLLDRGLVPASAAHAYDLVAAACSRGSATACDDLARRTRPGRLLAVADRRE